MKIGFIGTGDIAEAVITGIMCADFPVEEISVSARSRHISSRLSETYDIVRVFEENQQVIDSGCDLVFLAVLPQQAKEVLEPLQFCDGQEVASLIATIPVEQIADWSGATGLITRAVPLPPVAELRAVTVLSGPSERLETLFERLGGVIVAQSLEQLNALSIATTMMGTVFGIQETVTEWMGQQGVCEPDARRFVSSLFLALAKTGVDADRTFAELRRAHSTPGGLNAQTFEVFSEEGGRDALTKALESVLSRTLAASDKS
ncbi:MAG: pyrroline-5-carboxylate reductase [Sedimentitalea sp.]|uniref:pyrroline-5-carboxylate reductase n=1 Tax=Sedimentitalea sp. TaxID=2048915 RepID=UPI00326349E3